MTPKDVIRNTIETCHGVLMAYVSDLSDEELMVRPVDGANHIAWQLGHLVAGENQMITQAGYAMPPLPDGFVEAYTKETSTCDDAAKFHKKDEFLKLMAEQREGTYAALEAMPESDLDRATPEEMKEYAPTVGSAFNIIGIHAMMHAPQFAVVRRKLGKPILI